MSAVENLSAFPFPEVRDADGCGIMEGSHGMTLRDYFAGQALPFALDLSRQWLEHVGDDNFPFAASAARDAYQIADAMLAARQEQAA